MTKSRTRFFAFCLLVPILFVIFPQKAYADDELMATSNLIFTKDNSITIKEGTTPGFTNIYLDSDLNTPLTPPGFLPATSAGYDLSGYGISSGYYGSGRLVLSSSITMLGGQITGIYGGGQGGTAGNVAIKIYGGTVTGSVMTNNATSYPATSDRFTGNMDIEISGGSIGGDVICGGRSFGFRYLQPVRGNCTITISGGSVANNVGVHGIDPSYIGIINVSGGYIGGSVLVDYLRPYSGEVRSSYPSDINISGGTICKDISILNTSPQYQSDLSIIGGTIRGAVQPVPTNGSAPVYKTALNLPNITAETNVSSALYLSGEAINYGKKDLVTTSTGSLTLYLPEGVSNANYNGAYFQADVLSSSDPNNEFRSVAPPLAPASNISDDTAIPKTGDNTPVLLLLALIEISGVGLVVRRLRRLKARIMK